MFASCGSASRLSKADTPWTYEIESVGVGADGTYAIRVWSYYKNAKMPLEVAKRNAVHAVIFKGVPAGNGAASQPPLKTDAVTASDSVFFGNFFQGEYQDYINSVASGSLRILKLRAREYKIGYVVSVAKDNLRKYLEDQGVIKGLSSGF
ncbi:MAG TPA: hypothetical protein IAB96_10160 [Candidatus Coprenecus pullicola]|nr:hypothetical protein [Candidatus Coprenecus pullicola]